MHSPEPLPCFEGLSDVALECGEQTIATLLDPRYWLACCPWLHVTDGHVTCPAGGLGPAPSSLPEEDAARVAALRDRGFFRVGAAALALPVGLARALELGVLRLVALGHEPSAINAYDEAWAVAAAVAPLLGRATGNVQSGDWMTFLVSGSRHVFTNPHRDKPLAGAESFRPDGAPMYATAWVALSDATAESSCLYFLPANLDAGYALPGDAVREGLPHPTDWPSIQAQPCASGELLCFSHRLLHWGSTATAGAPPRVAISFSMADPSFEAPAFDCRLLPLPPLPLRLALTAGQAILYAAQSPLSKARLALENRVFASQQAHFSAEYADRVLSAAQFLKFVAPTQGGRGGLRATHA